MAVGVLTAVNNKVDVLNGIFQGLFTADGTPSASSVFCGFTPRIIIMQQIGGAPGATWHSEFHEGMTAAYAVLVGNTGAGTIPTTNGFTTLVGNESAPAAQATNSPNAAGPGFTIGTGVQGASLVYKLTAVR